MMNEIDLQPCDNDYDEVQENVVGNDLHELQPYDEGLIDDDEEY